MLGHFFGIEATINIAHWCFVAAPLSSRICRRLQSSSLFVSYFSRNLCSLHADTLSHLLQPCLEHRESVWTKIASAQRLYQEHARRTGFRRVPSKQCIRAACCTPFGQCMLNAHALAKAWYGLVCRRSQRGEMRVEHAVYLKGGLPQPHPK